MGALGKLDAEEARALHRGADDALDAPWRAPIGVLGGLDARRRVEAPSARAAVRRGWPLPSLAVAATPVRAVVGRAPLRLQSTAGEPVDVTAIGPRYAGRPRGRVHIDRLRDPRPGRPLMLWFVGPRRRARSPPDVHPDVKAAGP